jgi:hypothetical protein
VAITRSSFFQGQGSDHDADNASDNKRFEEGCIVDTAHVYAYSIDNVQQKKGFFLNIGTIACSVRVLR